MKRLFSIWALLILLTGCHLEGFPFDENKEEQSLTVKVETADAIEVDHVSARLEASFSIENADSNGGLAYFYYMASEEDAPEMEAAALAADGKRLKAGSVAVTDSTFRTAVTDLTPSTLYRFVASILIDGEEFFGAVKGFTTTPEPGVMSVTGKADEITEVSALLSAYAHPAPGLKDYTMGILCSTEQEPDFNNGQKLVATEMNVKNKYTVRAEQLTPDTTYYFRSFLQFGSENRFGEIQRFRTLKLDVKLTTAPASDLSLFSATLNGTLQVSSKADLDKEVWFLYGESEDLATLKEKGRKVPATLGADGQFSGPVTMLQCAHEYHYVACARVYDREVFGEVQNFTTADIAATVVTGQATDLGLFTATLSATLTVENQEELPQTVWFLYVEDGEAEGMKVTAAQKDDGTYYCQLTGLKYNTEYQFVAGARVQDREVYGEVVRFRTEDIHATITTGDATEVSLFKAKLSGTLKVENPEPLSSETGFLYGTDSTLAGLQARGIRVKALPNEEGNFSIWLNTLLFNTKYSFVAVAKVHDKDFYGEVNHFQTANLQVTVTTGDASDIDHFTVTLNATLEVDNPETLPKKVWFQFGEVMDKETLLASGTRFGATLTDDIYSARADHLDGKAYPYLAINTEYYYMACADVDGATFTGDVKAVTTKDYAYFPVGEAVDMGLSVKWCSKNLGATSPDDFGLYVPWGEILPRAYTSWNDYKWGNKDLKNLKLNKYGTHYNNDAWEGYPASLPDEKEVLDDADDIARVKLGGGWRMPTMEEFLELIENTNGEWVTQNGVSGIRLVSKINGKSIFLPAAGAYFQGEFFFDGCRYWSRSLLVTDPWLAKSFFADNTGIVQRDLARCNALFIRPVTE